MLGVASGESPCFSDSKCPEMAPGESTASISKDTYPWSGRHSRKPAQEASKPRARDRRAPEG